MAQQKVRIEIPKSLTPAERRSLAERVIDHIVERTQSGKRPDGKAFKKYASTNPKAGSTVDLTLSGSMLGDIQLLNERSGSITVGFEDGTTSNAKAEGNIKGTYGGPPTGKARPFLGISKSALNEIVREISDD